MSASQAERRRFESGHPLAYFLISTAFADQAQNLWSLGFRAPLTIQTLQDQKPCFADLSSLCFHFRSFIKPLGLLLKLIPLSINRAISL